MKAEIMFKQTNYPMVGIYPNHTVLCPAKTVHVGTLSNVIQLNCRCLFHTQSPLSILFRGY